MELDIEVKLAGSQTGKDIWVMLDREIAEGQSWGLKEVNDGILIVLDHPAGNSGTQYPASVEDYHSIWLTFSSCWHNVPKEDLSLLAWFTCTGKLQENGDILIPFEFLDWKNKLKRNPKNKAYRNKITKLSTSNTSYVEVCYGIETPAGNIKYIGSLKEDAMLEAVKDCFNSKFKIDISNVESVWSIMKKNNYKLIKLYKKA